MVNRYFPDEEMPALRRYSTRAPGYSLSHDREPILSHDMHHNYRAQHAQIHDRNPDRRSPDNDMSSKPRSRIPVAVSLLHVKDCGIEFEADPES